MHPDELTLNTEDSVVLHQRGDTNEVGRSILIRLVTWGEVANTPQGREVFARGAFDGVDPTSVVIESQRHDGAIVGKGEVIENAADGAYLRARISDTTAGNDLLTLIKDRVISGASVLFKPVSSARRADGVIQRTKAGLARVAVLPNGAYPSAQVLEVRSEHTMSEPTPATPEPTQAPVVDLGPINTRLDAIDTAVAAVAASQAVPAGEGNALARFDSFGEAWLASTTDPEARGLLERVLADQVTGDNDGLILPSNNIGRIILPIQRVRKSVSAFNMVPLPESGMAVTWPEFDATSTFVVDDQSAEKAEVSTGTVKHIQKSAPVRTFAGASDVSLQLLQRSSPSYRELLLREYARQWALRTNQAFVTIVAGSATVDAFSLTGVDDAADAGILRAKLFELSGDVEDASGVPANVVLAAPDVFQRIGQNTELFPAMYGTQNVAGVAAASTLRINVSGLEIVREPQLASGKMITSESDAAGWMEDGPRIIDAENVAQLGHDYAIYSFGNGAIFREAAVIVSTVTLV